MVTIPPPLYNLKCDNCGRSTCFISLEFAEKGGWKLLENNSCICPACAYLEKKGIKVTETGRNLFYVLLCHSSDTCNSIASEARALGVSVKEYRRALRELERKKLIATELVNDDYAIYRLRALIENE